MIDTTYSSSNTDCPPNLLLDGALGYSSLSPKRISIGRYSTDIRQAPIIDVFDTAEMVVLPRYSLPETIQIRDSESIEAVKSFRTLEDDWNGYGATKPSEAAILNSIRLIRNIENSARFKVDICYPLDNGGIQIDISAPPFDYELEVFDDSFELLKFNQSNSLIDTVTLPLDTIDYIAEYFQ
ncbi:hypothetical protein [Parapedobacter soli]|uniref:hypothetical protein n=1 Tax=Parapedobacter soli TaxID=416955 RepID=UPI0021C7894A|nr:hypothetical protein [Parapedobacter soli]